MSIEKYGFVYIWRDRKHNRNYIGCHWGREDDGYICSSRWMRNSFRRRPRDFKRRILARVYSNRADLFLEEYRWLEMIKTEELGKRYYNLSINHPNHWSTDPLSVKIVSDKISKFWTDSKRLEYSLRMKHNNPMNNRETVEKIASKNRGRLSWNKGIARTEEQKLHQSLLMRGRIGPTKGRPSPSKGIKRTPEIIAKHSKEYIIIDPQGEEFVIKNLTEFCKTNNLGYSNMLGAVNSSKPHKGFMCRKYYGNQIDTSIKS